MNTIKIYLAESGRIANIDKNFPLYQHQYNNKLLNVFVPTSIIAPIFSTSGNDTNSYVAGTALKIGMTYTSRNGTISVSKNYYMRFLKILTYQNVEYAMFERKLPKEFTLYAGQGENAPTLIANVVNIQTTQDFISVGEEYIGEITTDTLPNNATLNTFVQNEKGRATQENDVIAVYLEEIDTPTKVYKYLYLDSAWQHNEILPTILDITDTQTCSLDVMPSQSLDNDETVEATEIEIIEASINAINRVLPDKQDKTDVNLNTANKTIVGAINELNTQVVNNTTNIAENTANIAENSEDIAYLYQHLSMAEYYIGTMRGSSLPTNFELNTFDTNITGRNPINADTIIFILEIEGETDKNYKFIYTAENWSGYEIPPMEEANNGSLGIIEGTYAIGSNNNTLVNIIGGQILDIFVKDNDNNYRNIKEYLNTTTTNIENIINGNTQVGLTLRAVQDKLGNDIVDTYLTINAGATKQFVRDYALPRIFNDVNYITADGFSKDIPTTPESGIQFEITTNSVGSATIFDIQEILTASYELSRENGYNNKFWIASDKNTTVEFRLTTSAKKASDHSFTNIGIELSNTINLTANTLTSISFDGIFDLLGQDVLKLDVGDMRSQQLEVITQSSEITTFSLYCNSTIPSTFYMKTLTQVIDINTIGEAKEIFVNENAFVLDESGIYKATILQTTHNQPVGNNYIIQGSYATDANTYRAVALDFSIDNNGDITIWAEEPENYRILIASKMETSALGILRLTNPVVLQDINYEEIGAIEITQNTSPTNLVLPDPLNTSILYKIFVFNNAFSTETINVNGLDIVANSGRMYIWQGAWIESNSNGITTENVWDSAKNQWLSTTLSTLVDENDLLNTIGQIIHLDCNATLDANIGKITLTPVPSLAGFEIEHNKEYYINAVLGVSTLTGELQDSYTIEYLENGNTVNINSIINPDEMQTITVGQLCPLMEAYNEVQGYVFSFRAIAKIINNEKYFYITNLQRELNPPMTGQNLYTAIVNNTLKPFTTVVCMSDYTNGTTTYLKGHIYKITGIWNAGVLIIGAEDITAGSAPDDVTINTNTQGKLQAIGLTDGSTTITASEVIAGLIRKFL